MTEVRHRLAGAVAILAGIAALLVPASAAPAATQIGATFVPDQLYSPGYTSLQSGSPGGQYSAPFAGLLTSWSYQASATNVPVGLELKVARAEGGDVFTIVAESGAKNPAAGLLNTYGDIRIPVKAGDVLGLYTGTGVGSVSLYRDVDPLAGYREHELEAVDASPGTKTAFDGPFDDIQLDVAATLEPDADGDGFIDGTEDRCPSQAGTQGTCATKKKKCKKKKSKGKKGASGAGKKRCKKKGKKK